MTDANLLLYVNLTGEVFYIVGHRMKSQNVRDELQSRVYNDLAMAICHPNVVKELLEGSLKVLNLPFSEVKIIMDRIVHSSIMTVNAFSMEKLFELTLIATKYQYSVCQNPKDILLVALNHLDTIRSTLTDVISIQLTENLHRILVDLYGNGKLAGWIMQQHRYAILDYLIDVRLKMTNLIKLGYQKPTGEFVKNLPDKELHPDSFKPGTIEIYDYEYTSEEMENMEDVYQKQDKMGQSQQMLNMRLPIEEPSDMKEVLRHVIQFDTDYLSGDYRDTSHALELRAPRGIRLGLSIYDLPGNFIDEGECDYSREDERPHQFTPMLPSESRSTKFQKSPSIDSTGSEPADLNAIQGLDLCSILLGCNLSADGEASKSQSKIKLGVTRNFDITPGHSSEESGRRESSGSINVVKFDARTNRSTNKAALAAIAKEFDMEDNDNSKISRRNVDIIFDDE